VVERAVAELARQARDREHAALWAKAATDPGFRAEVAEVGHEFEADDRAAWELE
jgi:phage replication-related protein YjqB (UPF0714/DUF867 family)